MEKPKPDWAFRWIVLVGIVLIFLAHCTPLGKLPTPTDADQAWRERHGR